MPVPAAGFAPGDLAMLVDAEGNRHFTTLEIDGVLHTHLGAVDHAGLLGADEGIQVISRQGQPFVAVRPRLVDYVMVGMHRQSGIVYPKDAAQILAWADIGPGMRVLESGIGSGGLTLALLRAVGPTGQVVAYEERANFVALAQANVHAFGLGGDDTLIVRQRDIYEGIDAEDGGLDRVVLDLAEPWRVLPHLEGRLRLGGWLAAYNPSVIQVQQLADGLRATRRFVQVETYEVLLRAWYVREAAVRPEQQMVGHTGWVTVARFVAEGAGEETERRVRSRSKKRGTARDLV